MTWFYYALASSLLWGISYSVAERIVKNINISTSIMIGYFIAFMISLSYNILYRDIKVDFENLTFKTFSMIVFTGIINTAAVFLINNAIQQKNATYAGLIEISYPVFTIIASYLIFGDMQINMRSVVGALLIFSGIFFMTKA